MQINIEGIENLSSQELASKINKAFLEPLEEYQLSSSLPHLNLEEHSPEIVVVSEERVFSHLSKLNPAKACGPDEIPNWFLREPRLSS